MQAGGRTESASAGVVKSASGLRMMFRERKDDK